MGLVAGFALKAQCLTVWTHFLQYERLCYNDIQPLYAGRGIDADTSPYVNGSFQDGRLVGGAIEYPGSPASSCGRPALRLATSIGT